MAADTEGNGPIAGRVAMVTGASRGIGAAIAADLVHRGYRVAGTCRGDHPEIEGVEWFAMDISSTLSVDAAFDAVEGSLGPVEVLVANAGITRDGLSVRMSDEDFEATLNTNLTGTFRCVRRATQKMMRARWGRVVMISSVSATLGQAGQANYAASKAGLGGYARSVSRELAGRNICVNIVAPGPIETEMLDAISDSTRALMLAAIPAGRLGTPSDVAAAVAFLASDEAGYITGQTLGVDGGMAMR